MDGQRVESMPNLFKWRGITSNEASGTVVRENWKSRRFKSDSLCYRGQGSSQK